MRFSTVGILFASLLIAGAASAAEGKAAGTEGGKGGAGPGGGGTGPGAAGTTTGSQQYREGLVGEQPDMLTGEPPAYKPWEVGAILESHRLIRQNDLAGGYAEPGSPDSGAAVNKFMNELGLYARYDITDKDRVGIRSYIYQYFLADQGETGFRTDDLYFTYTRLIPLPQEFRLQASGWVTAPISYTSQLMGLITMFRGSLELDRTFLRYLNLDLRTFDEYFLQRYTSYAGSGGAVPTPLDTLAFAFQAELHMPFYEPLSVGIDVYDAYQWVHQINTGPGGQNSTKDMNGVVQDPQFANQPIQQSYGGEVFVHYLLPPFAGIKTDLTLALAQGDPTLGYTSLLHDGVAHGYLFYRQSSEIYAALGIRY